MEWLWLLFIFSLYCIFINLSNKEEKKNEVSPLKISAKQTTIPNKRNLQNKSRIRINEQIPELKDIKLHPEQKYLFNLLETSNQHLFITGKAGTGKSVLLRYFKVYTKKNVVVLAPTGVAALNIGGQTIHSFFKIRPGFVNKDELHSSRKIAELLQHVDTIVIDEISMVRADLMDAIDIILRKSRRNSQPFGGAQIVMFGDLYQLPPVVEDQELEKYFYANHGGFYFFNADVWKRTNFECYELTHIHRQQDESFKQILNLIRENKFDEDLLELLNQRVNFNVSEDHVITLATTNQIVSEINQRKLNQINAPLYEYKGILTGEIKNLDLPTDLNLNLKVGAQVMFVKNDKDKRWVNGTIGIVEKLSKNEIRVNIDGITYPVYPEVWKKIRYIYNRETGKIEEEEIGSFTQYPLKLAWALTIHKAQGQTYERVIIDIGQGAFAHGQVYVALSRCKSLEGIFLKREIFKEDIIVDPCIVNFMKKVKVIKPNENLLEKTN